MFTRNEETLIDSLIKFVSGGQNEDKVCDGAPCENGIHGKDVPTDVNTGEDIIDAIIGIKDNSAKRRAYIKALSDKFSKASLEGFNARIELLNDKLYNARNNKKINGYVLRRNIEDGNATACIVKIFYDNMTNVTFRLEKNTDEEEGSISNEIKNTLSLIFRYGNIHERPSNLAVEKIKSLAVYCNESLVSTIEDALTAAYVKRDIDKGSLKNYRCGEDSVVYILKFSKNGHDNLIELDVPTTSDKVTNVVSFDVVKEVTEKFGGFETPGVKQNDKNGVTGTTFRDCCGLESDRNSVSEMPSTTGFVRLDDDYPVDTDGAVMTTASTVINDSADSESEMVNHPSHYNQYPVEVIDMMARIWGNEATAQWCEMTAFKYRMRMGHKSGNEIGRDFDKEQWYLKKAEEMRSEKSCS